MKLHPSLTFEVLEEAVRSSTFGLENKGFCVKCGCEHDGMEPDARRRECEECGEKAVFGAEEIMLHMQISG